MKATLFLKKYLGMNISQVIGSFSNNMKWLHHKKNNSNKIWRSYYR